MFFKPKMDNKTLLEFKEIVNLNTKEYLLLFLGSSKCPPCMKIDANFTLMARLFESSVKFIKQDCEECDDLRLHFGVHFVPTFLIFRKGETTPFNSVQSSDHNIVIEKIFDWIGKPDNSDF